MVHPTLRAGALLVLMALASAADAATITVNTTAQSPGASGDCTLGEAIQAANTNAAVDGCTAGAAGSDTIVVPAGIYLLTTSTPDVGSPGGATGLPHIASPIVIVGASAETTAIERSAAASSFRLFRVLDGVGASLGLRNLTLRARASSGPNGIYYRGNVNVQNCRLVEGAGIDSEWTNFGNLVVTIADSTFEASPVRNFGTLTITNSTFAGSGPGRAVAYGSTYDSVKATITDSIIRDNPGGGLSSVNGFLKSGGPSPVMEITRTAILRNGTPAAPSYGGGIYNFGVLTITDSELSENRALMGGGYGSDSSVGRADIVRSLIAGNTSSASGGGIHTRTGTLNIVNTTISGNRAGTSGGGIYGWANLRNATVAFNLADSDANGTGSGGGLAVTELNLTVRNSIVAANGLGRPALISMTDAPDPVGAGAVLTYTLAVTGTTNGSECVRMNAGGGRILSEGYNVVGNVGVCEFEGTVGDQIGTSSAPLDPRLGPLAANGGRTRSHAIAATSPARNAGNPAAPGSGGTACEGTDQRGVTRPDEGRCDSGAYEGSGGAAIDPGYAIVVRDSLPDGVFFESVSTSRGSCTGGQTITCPLGNVPDGEQAVVTIRTRVRTAGTVTNTATLGRDGDTAPFASASASTTVTGTAHTISGRVVDTLGRPSIGTPVTLSGSDTRATTTDGAGGYTFVVLPGGDYTVTPSRLWHLFAPGSQSYAGLMADVTADFVATPDTGLLLGAGPFSTEGGWFATRGGADTAFMQERWARLPWPTYNATGGGVHPALGDVDHDGFQEVVLGTGRGGNGWLAVLEDARSGYPLAQWLRVDWPAYNAANGETFPAVGNIDSDPAAEIVVGLGPGGGGWFVLFDDASTGYALIGWRRVNWPEYAANGDGATHPAIANLDGVGSGEIVLGLGQGSEGWVAIINGAASNYQHRAWVQVPWAEYNAANGTTWPAAGDVDGDGLGEIVVGLGRGSRGWLAAFDDAGTGFRFTQWIPVAWDSYIASVGETHPAIGNLDGDPAEELVIGFAAFPGEGGWFQVRDDATRGFSSLAWVNLGWEVFRQAGGALFPAMKR